MSVAVKQESKQIISQESYWDRLPFCSKLLFLVTVAFASYGYFYDNLRQMLANHVHFAIAEGQYSKLFTSFLVNQREIGVIAKLFFLGLSLPRLEKIYSTPYTIVQIFLQTFLSNLCFSFVGIEMASTSVVALKFFGFVNYYAIASLGVTHLIFIFIWAIVAINPDHSVNIYGLPLRVKAKYLPWCLFAVFSIFSPSLQAIIGFVLGYLQFMVLGRSIFCLPKAIYKFIDLLFPKCVRPILSYVSVQSAQRYLAIINQQNTAVPISDSINQRPNQRTSVQEEE